MRNLVGAPIAEDLASEALQLAERIRAGKVTPRDSEQIVRVIGRMTEEVVHHFFMHPTEMMGLGPTMRGLIQWGVNSAVKGILYGLQKVIAKLKPEQLRQVADFLDSSLYEPRTKKK